MTAPLIVAGRLLPSFSADLSTWQIQIFTDGRLVQEIREFDPASASGGLRQEISYVPSSELEEILATAERVGFWSFNEDISSTAWHMTDLETISICMRKRGLIKNVEVYGAICIDTHDPNYEQLKGFIELWEKIHKNAPSDLGKNLSLEFLEKTAGSIDDFLWKYHEAERARIEAFEAAAEQRGIMSIRKVTNGFAKCPFCGVKFALYSSHTWDGSRHKTCGTKLRLPERLKDLKTKEEFHDVRLSFPCEREPG